MVRYIFRRLIGLIPLLLGITIITFAVIHLAPGSPTDLETQFNPKVSLEVRQRIAHLYGLDKPLHVQYIDWLRRLIRLDFGISFVDSRPVIQKIGERIPVTLGINLASIILILLITCRPIDEYIVQFLIGFVGFVFFLQLYYRVSSYTIYPRILEKNLQTLKPGPHSFRRRC